MGFDTVIKQLHKFAIIFSFFPLKYLFVWEVVSKTLTCNGSQIQHLELSLRALHYRFSTSVLSGFFCTVMKPVFDILRIL